MDQPKNYKVLLSGEKPTEPHRCWIQLHRPLWIGGSLLATETDLPGALLLCLECCQHWHLSSSWNKMSGETWQRVSSRKADRLIAKFDKSKTEE